MTRDTDQYINICQEDVKYNQLKELFEKGLNALLADEYFLLLYVPKNGSKMQIVQPANDAYHRKRMIKRINEAKRIPSFYYALSHLWGITEDNRHIWEEISEYVDDINGIPAAPVSMRPEKRDPLLGLLRDHPDSYWWIDVLCARTDTPLDIMGDIYACCLECIAMVDCDPTLIAKLHTKQGLKEDFVHLWNRDQPPEELLHFKQLYEEYPQLPDHVCAFSESKWWQRVWTWQEMALPLGGLRFMSETGTQAVARNTITMDGLLNTCMNASRIMYHNVLNKCEISMEEDAKVTRLIKWFLEITQTRSFSKHRFGKSPQKFVYLFVAMEDFKRRCMNPVDYVYGILGIFQIKIPRMSDPNEVWKAFLFEMDNYMEDMKNEVVADDNRKVKLVGIDDDAKQVDLRKARCMADVYNGFLELEHIDDDEE